MKRIGLGQGWMLGALLVWSGPAMGVEADGAPATEKAGGWPERPAEIDATTWAALENAVAKATQKAKLVAADGSSFDFLGNSVALSGDTAVVGAPVDDIGANLDQGSAYVFTRSGTSWTLQAKLVAPDGAADDRFGSSVAISTDTALVGATLDDIGANSVQGSAYVFIRSGTSWTLQAKLLALDGAADDRFGNSVAISGDTALVGASSDDVGANSAQGSAYVFARSGGGWTQQAKLVAADGRSIDFFGGSVAVSGDTALIGVGFTEASAPTNAGAAYVFTGSGTTWSQQAKLVALDGAGGDQFGTSVALSGDTAMVGAPSDDVGANSDQGSAYVFTRSGTSWTQQAKLLATDGAASDFFGLTVAVSGGTAIVGAAGDDVGANASQGSAYAFARTGTTWIQQAQLVALDGTASDRFGASVALSGNVALLGTPSDGVGSNVAQGSAYVFSVSTGTEGSGLLPTAPLVSPGDASDNTGTAVSTGGGVTVVGAPRAAGGGVEVGEVYVYVAPPAGTVVTGPLTPNAILRLHPP